MAEEGSVYFANAYKFGFIHSILFVDFKSGYLNLWANISGIISNIFDLKFAPLISNYLALIPKILIIYLALFYNSILLKKVEHKFLFCLIVFLSPQNVPEIWMNSINSQIFFCIISFILIFISFNEKSVNNFYLALIFLAGMSGIYSCVLMPVYFFKYYIYKTKQDFYNFLVIFGCFIIQSTLIIYSKFSNLIYSGKFHSIDFNILVNYIYNVFIKVFLGTSLTKYFYSNFLNTDLNFIIYVIVLVFFIIFLFTFLNLKKKLIFNIHNNFIILSLLYALIFTSLIVMVGATGNYVGGRYAALPSFYLLCLVLIIYGLFNYSRIRLFFLSLITISILSGIYEFRPPTENIKHQYLKYLDCINCPNWSDEVEMFKKDENYKLKIWPYPRKNIKLN